MLGELVPAPAGVNVYDQRTSSRLPSMPRLVNVNSLPGSATSTRHVVVHCMSGSTLSPVKVVWSSSSHSADLHTGLNSPMRVMSATSAYTASGGASTVTESECWYFVRSMAEHTVSS